MSDRCIGLLLECGASALAAIGVIVFCWRARRPIRLAQYYDAQITELGMYGALPIYGFLRRYFSMLLSAAGVVVLVCVVLLVRVSQECPRSCTCFGSATRTVFVILSLFLGIHMTTIAAFETTKRRHERPYPIEVLVKNVRKRLWSVAAFLLFAMAMVAIVGTIYPSQSPVT